jgi:hypothetical protein
MDQFFLDDTFDRIVNCPLCGGTLECWHLTYESNVGLFKYYKNVRNGDHGEDEWRYSWQRETCPLCDGTGTALARVIAVVDKCKECGGRGSVETITRLEVGVRRENVQCFICEGKGELAQERIEIQPFNNPRKSCHIDLGGSHFIRDGRFILDLEGEVKKFFSKWQPASQSEYVRERREKARQAAERAKQQAQLKKQEEKKKQELVQDRKRQRLCVACGGALGLLDQMSGRERHKRCTHSEIIIG